MNLCAHISSISIIQVLSILVCNVYLVINIFKMWSMLVFSSRDNAYVGYIAMQRLKAIIAYLSIK